MSDPLLHSDNHELAMRQRYAAAHSRLMGPMKRARPVQIPPAAVAIEPQSASAQEKPANPAWWAPPVNFLSSPGHAIILRLVAAKHGLAKEVVTGRGRTKNVVAARDEAIALVYTHCRDMSLPAVAKIFNRDHTTILHSLRKLRKRFLPVYRFPMSMVAVSKSLIARSNYGAYQKDRHSNEAVQ